MSDPSTRLLQENLARLAPATQQALLVATQPTVTLDASGGLLQAFVTTADGRQVPVHGSTDPLAASAQLADRFAASNAPLVMVVGLGLGYLLDAMEARGLSPKVLAIEPLPAVTRAMLARRDWSAWLDSGRLTLLVGPDYTGSTEVWSLFGKNVSTPPTIMAPMLEREFAEEAERARELARQIVIGAKSNDEARRKFSGRYLLNTISNLPAIAVEGNAGALFGAFARVPCVVVAAGPSLDRNLPDLQKLEGKALIVAVDAAVRPLLAAGIRPHIVTTVDPSELNAQHLRDLPDRRGLWLVAEGSLDPAVVAQFPDRLFTFKVSQHHPWPWLEGISGNRGRLRAWGSVLTPAFDLACQMGCDPIVFAGADLAYTRGLQYCRNTVYEPSWAHLKTDEARADAFLPQLQERPHLTLPDVRGEGVVTEPHFVQFRDWLVSRANEAADRRIVNATGGGILIGGRIGQTDFSVLHLPKSRNDLGLRRRLANAWAMGRTARLRNLEDLERALVERKDLPVSAWLEFGGDALDATELEARLTPAVRGIRAAHRLSVYFGRSAQHADAQAATPESARAWIHPSYSLAETQARAHQAHTLLDYLQRAYAPPAGAPLVEIVRAAVSLPKDLRILDVGCGLGRAMEPLAATGYHVDGVDISARMLEFAQHNPKLGVSQFFLSDGMNCGRTEDAHYDLAYAVLSLQQIKSRSARNRLLAAIARALKPEGVLVVQLPFYGNLTADRVPAPNVPWTADLLDKDETPTVEGQVWATGDELSEIQADFSRSYHDIRLQFVDAAPATRTAGPQESITAHLIISGSPTPGLARRVFAPAGESGTTSDKGSLPTAV